MRLSPKFSKSNASPSIKISDCKLMVFGTAGYRSALATTSKSYSNLYFEARIENELGYARIGIATKDCEINGPIGIDEHGYSYGNKNGYGFHNSKRIRFGERFRKDDILSVFLYKNGKKMNLEFFINGTRLKHSFQNIEPGSYWPAVSVFGKCKVSCNFGPHFAYEDTVMMKLEKNK